MDSIQMNDKVKIPLPRAPIIPGSKRRTKYYAQIAENGGSFTMNVNLADPKTMIVGEECNLVMEVECTYADGTALPSNVGPSISMADILIDTIELEVKGQRFNYMNGNICDHFLKHWLIPNYIRDGDSKLHLFLTDDSQLDANKGAIASGDDANIWFFCDLNANNKIKVVRKLGDLPMFGTDDKMISGLIPMNFHIRTTDTSKWQRALRGNADIVKEYKISIKKMYLDIVTVKIMDEMSNQIVSEISNNTYHVDTFVNKLQVLNSGNVLTGAQYYESNVNLSKTPDMAYLLFLDESAYQNNATPYKQEYIFQSTFDNIDKVTITSGGNQLLRYDDLKAPSMKLELAENMSIGTIKNNFKGGENVHTSVFVTDNVISCIPIIFETDVEGFDPYKPMELRFNVEFAGGASKNLRPMLLTRTKNSVMFGSGPDNIDIK